MAASRSARLTDKTVPKQLTPFRPGQSGNPKGRPKGSRNATTLALESLLDGQAKALTQKAIDLALSGDLIALRICLDRILPVRKDRPIEFVLPPIETIVDAPRAISAITSAVARGEITANDAAGHKHFPRSLADAGDLLQVLINTVDQSCHPKLKVSNFPKRITAIGVFGELVRSLL